MYEKIISGLLEKQQGAVVVLVLVAAPFYYLAERQSQSLDKISANTAEILHSNGRLLAEMKAIRQDFHASSSQGSSDLSLRLSK